MNLNEYFPSTYIKAADLQGRSVLVAISTVGIEKVGNDNKMVVYFIGKQKGMIINKTNANTIAHLYGDETDEWVGKEIILYPAMVDFQGRTVPAIRVRGPQPSERTAPDAAMGKAVVAAALRMAPPSPRNGGHGVHAPPPSQIRAAPQGQQQADDMDDEIPF